MSKLILDRSFFVLSSEYRKSSLDEYYYLAKYLNLDYSSYLSMPIFIRRYLIDKLIEEYTKK